MRTGSETYRNPIRSPGVNAWPFGMPAADKIATTSIGFRSHPPGSGKCASTVRLETSSEFPAVTQPRSPKRCASCALPTGHGTLETRTRIMSDFCANTGTALSTEVEPTAEISSLAAAAIKDAEKGKPSVKTNAILRIVMHSPFRGLAVTCWWGDKSGSRGRTRCVARAHHRGGKDRTGSTGGDSRQGCARKNGRADQ